MSTFRNTARNNNAKPFIFSLLAFGLTLFTIDYISLRPSISSRRLAAEGEPSAVSSDDHDAQGEQRKPIMTTFFEPVPEGCCGMTQQGHENLVDAWTRAWQSHGWETRIFTEADALKHPSFELLQQKLIDAKVSEYDRRCFWRWLAMSLDDNSRGGWMSDYDLFPLTLTADKGLELMSQPGFKTFGGHVPALIHADKESWEKIVQMMVEALTPDMDISFISDMMLLEYLHKHFTPEEMGVTLWEFDLWKTFPYKRVVGQEDPVIDCEVVKNHIAVHLSHYGSQQAHEVKHIYPKIKEEIKKGEYAEYRAQAADVMMRDVAKCSKDDYSGDGVESEAGAVSAESVQ